MSRKKRRKQELAFPRPGKAAVMRIRRRELLTRNTIADSDLASLRERLTQTSSPAQEQFRADVVRFRKAQRYELRFEILSWQAALEKYLELYERPGRPVWFAVLCLHGIGRVMQVLRQVRPEEFPLEWEVDLAQKLVRLLGDADSHSRLGQAWLDLARPHDALTAAETAIGLDVLYLPAWDLAARCHRALGDRDRAREIYEHMLSLPDRPGMLPWRARVLLKTGNYAAGYAAHSAFLSGLDWRGPQINALRAGPVPHWTGEVMADGRLLLFLDGGFGDQFQMLRWVPVIRAKVGTLALAVGRQLVGFCSDQGWTSK